MTETRILSPRAKTRLLLIVLAATGVRVFTLWLGRAEFTGWLNHTYYYFVQVRGLLEHGVLPYPDMPLLFHLDALVARGLMGLGLELDAAVVAATRLVMCLVPSLIAVPVYFVVRSIHGGKRLRRGPWLLVALAAFLPLSLSYLPEFLQKNTLGLLGLAAVLAGTQGLLRRFRWSAAIAVALLALLCVLTHYGTFGALVLFAVAVLLARGSAAIDRRRLLVLGASLAAGLAVALGLIYSLDAQRFERLFAYLGASMQQSLVAALWSAEADTVQVVASLGVIAAFYGVLFACYRLYTNQRARLSEGEATFWLANILFSALLVLPIVDQLLMGRLALFASLPLLVNVAYVERYGPFRPWLKTLGVGVLAAATAVVAVGELVSSRIHNADHEAVLADLTALRATVLFTPNDLILARTGAEHVCNWFFGVKAGVITALELADFERYERVFVLNPLDQPAAGAEPAGRAEPASRAATAGRTPTGDRQRYAVMRRNIRPPRDTPPLARTDTIELFRLESAPADWLFGDAGRWRGYANPGSGAGSQAAAE